MHANILFPINAEAFTYLVPEELKEIIEVGSRVKAPFKKSEKIGIVLSIDRKSALKAVDKAGVRKNIVIKQLTSIFDEEPFLSDSTLKLIKWVSQYYMSTTGLALKNAVPSAFFSGKKAGKSRITYDEKIENHVEFELTKEQAGALKKINTSHERVFLLHGVTGSGKTEVYIKAIKSLPEDKKAIVLVPEIAITAQMIDRFRMRFGEQVVFFHSGLSIGERIQQWQKMRKGEVKVVIGVRSAVFAPFENLGLIVVDEEQEASYKQFDGLRYNARDVALARSQLEKAKVVLGSATPSLEAFYTAEKGKFQYLELKSRIEKRTLPVVEIIDMTKEEKQSFSLSNKLVDNLKDNISRGMQSLIMLNRRGYSPYFLCTDCGHTYKCPACSITLIYHKDTNTLNCHYCGSYLNPKEECPSCKGTKVKYLGTGTQRIEEELHSLIPEMSFQRMDRDTTQKKLAHYRIIKQMEEKKIDVLMGTQMVAKGHDFPDVTLSAVIAADIALNLPDFRSGERAFQLFTQLAGRAGRGEVPGRALIQTYEPEHYVFDYVIKHDYRGFYEKEIDLRKDLAYPPFAKLIRIVLSFRNKERGAKIIRNLSSRVKNMPAPVKEGLAGRIEILGPAPAPMEKIRNLWRWHIILKGKNSRTLRHYAAVITDKMKHIKELKIDVDIDPINLL